MTCEECTTPCASRNKFSYCPHEMTCTGTGVSAYANFSQWSEGYKAAIARAMEFITLKGVWQGDKCGELREYVEEFKNYMCQQAYEGRAD